VGVSFSDRYKRDGENPTGLLYPASGRPTAPFPTPIGVTDLGFVGLGGVASYDPLGVWQGGAYNFFPNPGSGVVAGRWQVREELSRAYAQLDLDTKVGSMPLTGNVGLQVIGADQSSTGNSATGTGATLRVVQLTEGKRYTDFAPSLNLNLKVAERTHARFSVARQLARPRMYDMRAGRTFTYNAALATSTDVNTSPWSGDGGNPNLEPWRSNSVDVSLERYFRNNMGYVALAAFHKDLLSYVYQQTELVDFTGYPVTTGAPPTLDVGKVTLPANGRGGKIRGLELTLSLPSELFFSGVRGFGVVLGGAYTDTRIEPWGPGAGTAPIPGRSRKVANATLYYERGGFSARVSERYRSEYRAFVTNFGPPNFRGDIRPNSDFRSRQPEYVVDAQISYSVQGGPLKGISVFLQGNNLNDEPLITYDNNDPRLVRDYQIYGASYSVGASYRF
jgi:iron complex outermembrane recepter protein